MTIPNWPTEMPTYLVEGYSDARADARRVSTFDTGPAKLSRRYTSVPTAIALTFRLKAWQKAVLDRFYVETCREGTVPFWMRKPYVDRMPILDEDGVKLLDENGAPLLWSHVALYQFAAPLASSDPRRAQQIVPVSLLELP